MLTPGTRFGAYEITAQLGAGGMGEVYRARDPQLKRDVAIKILPADVTADADRLARFQREAEVLASLNHTHIAHVFGIAEADGVRGIVMELAEGATLADVLSREDCRSTRRWALPGKWPRRSRWRTTAASSIAISSPPTSW